MTFLAQLDAVYATTERWHRPTDDSLRQLGAGLTPAEVAQALRRIEELHHQREQISQDPDLNCDDEDDVHFAQSDIAKALRHVRPDSSDALIEGLLSSCSSVRFWTSLAAKDAALPKHRSALIRALANETDQLTRQVMEEALDALGTVQ